TMGIAIEEVAHADFNMAMSLFYGFVNSAMVAALPDENERRHWTRAVASGEKLVCGAFTEPGGASDLGAIRLRATADGDGWRLSGEKTSVTVGPHADAAIVLATTDPSLGHKGIMLFLVDLEDPTISKQRFRDPGLHPLGRSGLTFDDT